MHLGKYEALGKGTFGTYEKSDFLGILRAHLRNSSGPLLLLQKPDPFLGSVAQLHCTSSSIPLSGEHQL
jgi:hypothetical protein